MRRGIVCLLSLALAPGLLSGCGGRGPAGEGGVSANGSTSMERVVGVLAEAFMAKNGGVKVTYDPTGSGTGIEAVRNGTCDIGLSSRALR